MGSARTARVMAIHDPADGALLDRALCFHFIAPHSVTGENLVEWHCHGGQAVVHAVLGTLARQPKVREAQPGEFTRRAFENGRIDLNEAEGLADLLAAETEAQRRAALSMAEGGFSRQLERWRDGLLRIAAMIEADLDFSDEDDVAVSLSPAVQGPVTDLLGEMRDALSSPPAERLRDGIRVVLAGPPNAGKSTLLNALVGRDAAIVSDIAGTTRDSIEAVVGIGGVPFVFTDTAGLRDRTGDIIEQMGMDRARSAIEDADIILWLGEEADMPEGALLIAAQCDRADWRMTAPTALALSARTGAGMDRLVSQLLERARHWLPREGGFSLHRRQRAGIADMIDALERCASESDMVLMAEDVRVALRALDGLIGKAGVEDMLDTLFSRFCIGK